MSVEPYTPSDWYWIIAGSGTQVYSSDRNALVPTSDATHQTWLETHSDSAIDSVQSLFDVLRQYMATASQMLAFGTATASAAALPELKYIKQAAHDQNFDAHFDISAFIRDGTITTITGANIGAFMAQIANNYRTLRSQIANAATPTALNAIDINSGWPANP